MLAVLNKVSTKSKQMNPPTLELSTIIRKILVILSIIAKITIATATLRLKTNTGVSAPGIQEKKRSSHSKIETSKFIIFIYLQKNIFQKMKFAILENHFD
jgi:hypothetical protein